MRLVTFNTEALSRPRMGAVLGDGSILDLGGYWATSASEPAPATTGALLAAGASALSQARELIAEAESERAAGAARLETFAPAEVSWHPPFMPPRILAIGLNYRSHAEEQGAKIPKNPIVFTKALSSLTGHQTPIISPPETEKLDYEAELAVVIGRRCVDVDAGSAMGYVAGYTCLNDVTARDLQRSDRQWFRAKSYPTFAPMGRELVTLDEAPPLETLVVSCLVGGELRQSAPVTDLIFGVPELISFLSSFSALEPGDVIATGTPGGVGFASDPPRFLASGDVVRVEIGGVSVLENTVVERGSGPARDSEKPLTISSTQEVG